MRRAEIDPLSNFIRPRSVLLRRDLKGFLIGPWPKHIVQSFLHELTHHWCFHSPLGVALFLLRARAFRRACAHDDEQFEEVDMVALWGEMLASETILNFLRPLSEGMALFSEYDLKPGSSQICTTPMLWAGVALFPRGAIPNFTDLREMKKLSNSLGDIRLEASSLRRKMSFLSEPQSRLDEVYLDGYLSVKRMFYDLQAKSKRFRDTDFFLSYLRAYVFEDAGAVAILTKNYADPTRRIIDYVDRFVARIERLCDFDVSIDEDACLFERCCNVSPGLGHSFELQGIGCNSDEQKEAKKGLFAMISELDDVADMREPHRSILALQRDQLSRRSIVFAASEPVLIKISTSNVATAWPDPQDGEYPLVTGVACLSSYRHEETPGNVSGWISLVIMPTEGFIAPILGVENKIIAILWPPGRERDLELEDWLANPLHSPPSIERELQEFGAWTDAYFKQAPFQIKVISDSILKWALDSWSRISRSLRERWNGGKDALILSDGLWSQFKPDQKKFETFVALGTMSGIDVLAPTARNVLLECGWDVNSALVDALMIKKNTGLDLICLNENGVIEWLI